MMTQVSQALISQHFSKKLIIDYLDSVDRLTYNFRYQDLKIEIWFNVIWTNFGFISYRNYAEFLIKCSECKSLQLPIRQLSDRLALVKGNQKSWYRVEDGRCECMLFRQRVNRCSELPQLFKHFSKPFCHHVFATTNSII